MFLRTLVSIFVFLVRLRFSRRLSLFQSFCNRYGGTIVSLVRKREKSNFKHRKAVLDLNFLQIFRSFNLISKLLQFRVAKKSLRSSQA